MTLQEVITEVRNIVQDSVAPYRYSDNFLLGFVNQTIKRVSLVRPDLFAKVADFATTTNTVIQSCPADSQRLIEIYQVKNGDAVIEVSREVMDQTYPTWRTEAADAPVNYMRHVRNPNVYFLYPRPSAGVVMIGEYSQSPPTYGITDEIALLPDTYFPAVVDGTVWLVESVDNEHVNSGRAKMFQDMFLQELGVNLQSRTVTDDEAGGMDPKRVI